MREIRIPNGLVVCSETVARQFLDLLQVEEERDIYAQGLRVVAYPDNATVEEVERLMVAAQSIRA
jgi:hypothetical protein